MKWTSILQQVFLGMLLALSLTGCDDSSWNNPHKAAGQNKNVYYSSFASAPKTLDPARSYFSDEIQFIAQIFEPPMQYDYQKRPYTLIPLTATQLPKVTYLDEKGRALPPNAPAKKIAFTVYEISIKPGIYYQPHSVFKEKRELTAYDYEYQIKRLAHPDLNSPVLSLMEKYIVGLTEYVNTLRKAKDKNKEGFLDLRKYPLAGVKVLNRYHYQIKIKGKYPQFKYWLTMPFFSPVPWEVDKLYSQPGMKDENMTFDWAPVGTGPYMMTENNPNQRIVLKKNPNFHGERYHGEALPFVDKIIYALEKESIPRWNKFLQGYYDRSSVTSDSFDQAIHVDKQGRPHLTAAMREKGIRLQTAIMPSVYYLGFNMNDEVVGGYSGRARKLRQAISIAVDYEEYISIFLNGRGIAAYGPLPPGIFGYRENNKAQLSLKQARKLMAEAGYPNGRDSKTGKQLLLNYDVGGSAGPDSKALYDWMRKQFSKLGIQLNVRSTQFNRYQEKLRTGNIQIYSLGWFADYPDPENFLFLLYGPNGKVKYGGENVSNYHNQQYDQLFDMMRVLPDGEERQKVIDDMLEILRVDTPWVWGFHPKQFVLSHDWVEPSEINPIANNTAKYIKIDYKNRGTLQKKWNKTKVWTLSFVLVILLLLVCFVVFRYWYHQRNAKVKRLDD